MLFGLRPVEDRRPEVTIPATSKCRVEGISRAPHAQPHPEDVWRYRGIPTTSPERLLLDMAPRLDDRAPARMMSRAQSMHLTNLRRLGRQLDRAAGRPGRARFARVLSTQPPATRTELEDRVHDLLNAAGLTPPHVNVPLHLDGRRVIPDFRWPEHHLIVEADSTQWHDTPQARADDADARRSSKPTANASSASPGTRPPPTPPDRATCRPRARPILARTNQPDDSSSQPREDDRNHMTPPAAPAGTRYRLVTRSDFDGLVCAALLKEHGILDDILFVHPKDVQDGKVELTSDDITTNLP